MKAGAVAWKEEARQRRREYDRIAHNDVGRAVADLVLAPRHRHDADGAGEVGHVESHFGIAVGADRHDAGIERQRRPGGRAPLQLRALVAAAANLPARALHAVDQVAIEVADFRRKRPLAEIVIVGRRRLVVGQIENADIDRGDHDLGVRAGGEPGKLHRNPQRRIRPQQRRRLDLDAERSRRAIDGEPLHANGAARHALRRRVERPPQCRDQIGARAPVAADRHLHLRDARLYLGGLARQQPIADDIEGKPAGAARGHRDRHAIARPVLALVERNFEHVGRIGVRLDIKAGVEGDRRHRPVGIAGGDFEPVAAERHRQGNVAGFVERRIDRSVGDALGGLDRFVVPAAVAFIELIMGVDAQKLVVQAALGDRGAVGRDDDDIERGAGAVGQRTAREQRLDADHIAARRHRYRHLVLDGAAAGLGHAHGDLRFERMRA